MEYLATWKESTYLLFFMRCCKWTSGQICFTAGALETFLSVSLQSTSSWPFHIKKWEARKPVLSANLKSNLSKTPNYFHSIWVNFTSSHRERKGQERLKGSPPFNFTHHCGSFSYSLHCRTTFNYGCYEPIFLENFFLGNLRRILLCTRSH